MELHEPYFTQADVVDLTLVKPFVLQHWVNREVLLLSGNTVGRGRRRLYSILDIVKVAVMRRCTDLSIDPSVSSVIANDAVDELLQAGGSEMDWDLHLIMRPRLATDHQVLSARSVPNRRYQGFDVVVGVADHIGRQLEWFEGAWSRRFQSRDFDYAPSDEQKALVGKVDPARRRELARKGIHSEPIVVIPLGEIVNGALEQTRAFLEQLGNP